MNILKSVHWRGCRRLFDARNFVTDMFVHDTALSMGDTEQMAIGFIGIIKGERVFFISSSHKAIQLLWVQQYNVCRTGRRGGGLSKERKTYFGGGLGAVWTGRKMVYGHCLVNAYHHLWINMSKLMRKAIRWCQCSVKHRMSPTRFPSSAWI